MKSDPQTNNVRVLKCRTTFVQNNTEKCEHFTNTPFAIETKLQTNDVLYSVSGNNIPQFPASAPACANERNSIWVINSECVTNILAGSARSQLQIKARKHQRAIMRSMRCVQFSLCAFSAGAKKGGVKWAKRRPPAFVFVFGHARWRSVVRLCFGGDFSLPAPSRPSLSDQRAQSICICLRQNDRIFAGAARPKLGA